MRYPSLTLALLALSQVACSGTKEVELTTLAKTAHCPIESVGLSVYRTPNAFAHALKSASKRQPHFAPDQEQQTDASMTLPPGKWAIVVNLGQQPSAGYSIELASEVGHVHKGMLTLQVEQHKPPPGTMQAMMITTPCVVVAVEAQEDVHEIAAKSASQRWHHAWEEK